MLENIFEDELPSYSIIETLLVFMLGILGALFIENVTISNIVLAISIIAFSFIKFKKIFPTHILFFISTIIGASIMFLNPTYRVILAGNDEYRSVARLEELGITIGRNIHLTVEGFLEENVLFLSVISALSIVIAFVGIKNSVTGFKNRITIVSVAMNVFSLVIIYIRFLNPWWFLISNYGIGKLINYTLLGVIAFIYFITIIVTIVLNISVPKILEKSLFFIVASITIIVPLFVASPIGPRCFMPSCIMLLVVILLLLEYFPN